uniref:Uncharacterized protein n=1 Tax=Arundo donax TaxID=35708 RepID=A0A0A9GV76_ARUDO
MCLPDQELCCRTLLDGRGSGERR